MAVRQSGNTVFPANAALADLQAALLEVYPDYIADLLPNEVTMVSLFKKFEGLEHRGRNLMLPYYDGRNLSAAARPERGTALPEAQHREIDKFEIPIRHYYGVGGFTKGNLVAAQGDGSIVDLFDTEVEGCITDLARALNVDLYGHPSGALAYVESSDNAAASTVQLHPTNITDDFNTSAAGGDSYIALNGSRHLAAGMHVNIGAMNQATGAITWSGGAAAIDYEITTKTDFNTIVVDGAVANTEGMIVVRHGTHGTAAGAIARHSMNGLDYLVDDGTFLAAYFDELQGRDRTTSELLRPLTTDKNGGALVEADVRGILNRITDASNRQPDLVLTTRVGADVLFEMFRNEQRFVPNAETAEAHGGYKAGVLTVAAGGRAIPVMVDRDCPYRTMYFLNTKHLKRIASLDFELADEDGNVLRQGSTGDDSWEFFVRWFGNMALDFPTAHGKIADIGGNGAPEAGEMQQDWQVGDSAAVIY